MKRWLWIGSGIVVVAIVGLCLGLEFRARKMEARWLDFVKYWEAEGESFSPENHLPPALAAEDEFAGHPWIRALVSGNAAALDCVERMNPETVEGYDDWANDLDEDGLPKPMAAELARRIRQHRQEFRPDLEALAEAARKPGSRLSTARQVESWAVPSWTKRLSNPAKLLEAGAHAAITLDDPPGFTEAIETLLQCGQKLRASNEILAAVVGCGLEGRAYDALLCLPEPMVWPSSEQTRWLAALECRTRSPADEFAGLMRVERGKQLAIIGLIEQVRAKRIPFSDPVSRRYFAQARLACCEPLQAMVLSAGGKISTPIADDRITRFSNHVEELNRQGDFATSFGLTPVVGCVRIYEAIVAREAIRMEIRNRLLDGVGER